MPSDQHRAARRDGAPMASSLRQACRNAGLDHNGERCPDCPLRQLCKSESRWLVKTGEVP